MSEALAEREGFSLRQSLKSHMDFLTKIFLVVSAFVAAVASAISMLFISCYLSVFDWTLIWLIDYSDLAKFFLPGTALLLVTGVIFGGYLQNFQVWLDSQEKSRWVFGGIVGSILVLGQALAIFDDYRTSSHLLTYHCYRALSYLTIAFTLLSVPRRARMWRDRDLRAIASDIGFLTISPSIYAMTFGYFVRHVSLQDREVWTKDDTYRHAKIIMTLSHHMAIFAYDSVIVIPTGDVVRIISTPAVLLVPSPSTLFGAS